MLLLCCVYILPLALQRQGTWGPFLVVAPASTLHNWQQECTKFVPRLKVHTLCPYIYIVDNLMCVLTYYFDMVLICTIGVAVLG